MTTKLGELYAEIGLDHGPLVTGARESQKVLKSLGDHGKKSLGSLTSAVFSLQGAVAGLASVAVAKTFIDAANEARNLQLSLDAITKGQGVETFKALEHWASRLPISTSKAIGTYRSLRAMGLEPTLDQMTTLVDTTKALGAGEDVLQGIARALGQIQTKGRVQAEELMQLAERGIPVYEILEEQLGLNAKAFENMSKSGVTAEQAVQAIFTGLADRFGGTAQKMQDKWEGLMARLGEIWRKFRVDVMESGLFSVMEQGLADVVNKLEELQSEGTLKIWAQEAGLFVIDAFTEMIRIAEAFVQAINVIQGSMLVLIRNWYQWRQDWAQAFMNESGFRVFFMRAFGVGPEREEAIKIINETGEKLDELDAKLEDTADSFNVINEAASNAKTTMAGFAVSARKAVEATRTPGSSGAAPALPTPALPTPGGIETTTTAVTVGTGDQQLGTRRSSNVAGFQQIIKENEALAERNRMYDIAIVNEENYTDMWMVKAQEREEVMARGQESFIWMTERMVEEAMGYWDDWAEHFRVTWEDVNSFAMNTMDQLAEGMGNAVAQMIVYGESFGQMMERLMKSVLASIIQFIVQSTIKWIISTFAKAKAEAAAQAAITAAYSASAVAKSAASGATKGGAKGALAEAGLVAGGLPPIISSIITAVMGIMKGAESASLGAAGGATLIPQETTALLHPGERVISPEQNRDLKDFMEGGGQRVTLVLKERVLGEAIVEMARTGTLRSGPYTLQLSRA